MSQYVQLQQVGVDGVVIKMGGDNIRIVVVGGMLHRSEGVDILPEGQHDDASRVLARGPADAGAAQDNAVDLAVPLVKAPLFIIFLHVAEGGLVRQGADGSGSEGLSGAEDHLRIFVGLALVLSGKVQVNIRLLVALKAQEGLKGNVKAHFL